MSERQKQSAFLKDLIRLEDTAEARFLEERVIKAERDERCIRRALFVMALFGLLSVSGLCYSAVFLQDFFRNSSHILIKTLSATSLGSIIGILGYLAFWMRYRHASNRVYAECRRFVSSLMAARHKTLDLAMELRVVQKRDLAVYQIATVASESGPPALSLPKAS